VSTAAPGFEAAVKKTSRRRGHCLNHAKAQPKAIGPFSFGTSTSAQTGENIKPGAFSITMIRARSDEEAQQIGEISREIVNEMLKMHGFIDWTGMAIGHRLMTVTA
jgi:hypothetical protein